MQKLIMGVVAAGILLLGVSAAVCAERPEAQDKIEERLEIITAWKMMERLNLDPPTAEKILGLRRKFVSQRNAIKKELGQDFQKLRSFLKDQTGKADDKEIGQVLQNIREKRKQLQVLMDEQFVEVSKYLSVRQQAELVLFLKDFHQEIRSLLRPPVGTPPDRGVGPRGGPPNDGAMGPSGPPRPPHGKGIGQSMQPMGPRDAGIGPRPRHMRPGPPEPLDRQNDVDEAAAENS